MFSRPTGEVSAAQRWGAIYFVLGIAYEVFGRRENDVTKFVLDTLAFLTAAFLGPAVVHIASHLLRTQWNGVVLAVVTFGACFVVTLGVSLLFRSCL
jgi:hypothetical protein